MTDRVYPTKPTTNGTNGTTAAAPPTTNGGSNHTFPTNKAQLYNATRPAYRPIPPPRRRRRSCCFCCCLWTTFFIITVLLLVAIVAAVVWFIYRPQPPHFSVSNLQLTQFNVTSTAVISKFNLTLTARNPNKKVTFSYDPITISILSNDVKIGDGSFRSFHQGTKNTTTLKTAVSSSGQTLESSEISSIRSEIRSKKNLPLKIQLDTRMNAKLGSIKSKKVSVRVTCEGLQVAVPTGKTPATAKTSGVKCKVDPRVKILKWTI